MAQEGNLVYGRAAAGLAVNSYELGTRRPDGMGGFATLDGESNGDLTGTIGGAVGYRFALPQGGSVSLESEISYRSVSIDDANLSGVSLPPPDLTGFVLPILFNVRYDYELNQIWRPFLTAGVGPTLIDLGTEAQDGLKAGIGYQIGGGVALELRDGIEVEGRYRYLNSSVSGEVEEPGLEPTQFDATSSSHEFLVGLSIPIWTPRQTTSAARTTSLLSRSPGAPEPRMVAASTQTTPDTSFDTPANPSALTPAQAIMANAEPEPPAPASAMAAAAASSVASGPLSGYWVQVGAFRTMDQARTEIDRAIATNPAALAAGQPRIQQAYSDRLGGEIYRVQFGPYAQAQARQICAAVGSCLVTGSDG